MKKAVITCHEVTTALTKGILATGSYNSQTTNPEIILQLALPQIP